MYNMKSENDLFRAIVNEIYEIKKGKALVPFEKYENEKIQLQKALYEIGRLKGILEEKEKQLEEQKKQTQKEKKGFGLSCLVNNIVSYIANILQTL